MIYFQYVNIEFCLSKIKFLKINLHSSNDGSFYVYLFGESKQK